VPAATFDLRPWELRGLDVVGADGRVIGDVADTWPLDGGGEVALLLVRVGSRFRRHRYLPLAAAEVDGGRLRVPFAAWEIDDAPAADDRRWGDPAHVALAYWSGAGPD